MTTKNCWLVVADKPKSPWLTGWDYGLGFFPRKVFYKKDAKALAEEVKSKGGLNVRVVRDNATQWQ